MKYFAILISLFILTTINPLFAQSYTTAGGIRLGTEVGLTLQQRVAKRLTVEGILQQSLGNSAERDEFVITALLEKHNPVLGKRLNVYMGGGLHKGWTTGDELTYDDPFGITGVLGAEFTIGRLNLSYDIKPSINLVGGSKSFYMHTGVSARYVFVKQKVFNDMLKKQKKNKKKRKKDKKKKNGNDKFWEKWL